MNKKLKNCPFCGSKPKCDNGFSPLESVYYVWCDNVDCILSPCNGDDRLFDVDLWNERRPQLTNCNELCNYCDISEYRGHLLPLCKNIDGAKQNFGIGVFDSPEDECCVLEVSGVHTDLRVEIKYCPMCGRRI